MQVHVLSMIMSRNVALGVLGVLVVQVHLVNLLWSSFPWCALPKNDLVKPKKVTLNV